MTAFADIPVCDFAATSTIRLIATDYVNEPALGPLADSPADLVVLEAVEGLTSARRAKLPPLPGGISASELLGEWHGYGWTYINAAFCYTRATGNRFNGPERGAWYACHGRHAAATAQAEVAWHLSRELTATGVFDNVTAYRELVAGFMTRFHDLRALGPLPCLDADPALAYDAGQLLARQVLGAGGNGVLYPSARRKGGHCLAAFRPHLVQNVRQGQTWQFTWKGSARPEIRPI